MVNGKRIVCLALAAALVCGCTSGQSAASQETKENSEKAQVQTYSEPGDVGAWLPYWKLEDGREELVTVGSDLSSISFFEAYFDEEDQVVLPDSFADQIADIRDGGLIPDGTSKWITVVNDVVKTDGSVVQKDPKILKRLLATKKSRQAHAEELVALALSLSVDGVEIDYEKIPKDAVTGKRFGAFVKTLDALCRDTHLSLRIILESGADIKKLKLKTKTEYVIMCYNLYGWNEQPGPKADKAFCKQIAKKFQKLPGTVTYALATGGFDWKKGEQPVSLTKAEAVEIFREYAGSKKRDKKSGALTFTYTDADGAQHTVWYADNKTLSKWKGWLDPDGSHSVMIWCLGGNQLESMEDLLL